MRKISIIVLLFLCSKTYSQVTDSNKLKITTPKQVEDLFKVYENAKKQFAENRSKKLLFYYEESDLFNFIRSNLYDRLISLPSLKDKLLKASVYAINQLSKNYEAIDTIIKREQITSDDLEQLFELVKSNDHIYKYFIPEVRILSVSASIWPYRIRVRVTDGHGNPLTDFKAYFISRYECRKIMCGDCDILKTKDCISKFVKNIRERDSYNSVYDDPVELWPGAYNLFIVVGSIIIYHDFMVTYQFKDYEDLLKVKLNNR